MSAGREPSRGRRRRRGDFERNCARGVACRMAPPIRAIRTSPRTTRDEREIGGVDASASFDDAERGIARWSCPGTRPRSTWWRRRARRLAWRSCPAWTGRYPPRGDTDWCGASMRDAAARCSCSAVRRGAWGSTSSARIDSCSSTRTGTRPTIYKRSRACGARDRKNQSPSTGCSPRERSRRKFSSDKYSRATSPTPWDTPRTPPPGFPTPPMDGAPRRGPTRSRRRNSEICFGTPRRRGATPRTFCDERAKDTREGDERCPSTGARARGRRRGPRGRAARGGDASDARQRNRGGGRERDGGCARRLVRVRVAEGHRRPGGDCPGGGGRGRRGGGERGGWRRGR